MQIKLIKKEIEGVFELVHFPFIDKRGSFVNLFRPQEDVFKRVWKDREIKQINISENNKVGTIRGMHLQKGNYSEAKIIRCIKGTIFDVVVDLRKDSKTYGKWCGLELSDQNGKSFLIPEGCAHGFQVLKSNSKVLYFHSNFWNPEFEAGIIFNDPKVNIKWPLTKYFLSKKDLNLPNISEYEI